MEIQAYMDAFEQQNPANNTKADSDGPASDTQVKYLNDLGLPKSEASLLTRAEASAKIDELRDELAEVSTHDNAAS
jgi:hypothetical protein